MEAHRAAMTGRLFNGVFKMISFELPTKVETANSTQIDGKCCKAEGSGRLVLLFKR